jgi:hypothetical protein
MGHMRFAKLQGSLSPLRDPGSYASYSDLFQLKFLAPRLSKKKRQVTAAEMRVAGNIN